MGTLFDTLVDEIAAPLLFESLGENGILQIDGISINAIVCRSHVEPTYDVDIGSRIHETRKVHFLRDDLLNDVSMTTEIYIGSDPDPWSINNITSAGGPIVTCELIRRYISDRSKIKDGE